MSGVVVLRQHLIDPEICIRCNTCEETCKQGAITHDKKSYAVHFERCNACGDCLPPCPTGAIDSWRRVLSPYSIADQLLFESLPADVAPPEVAEAQAQQGVPEEVALLSAQATEGQGGRAPPPWSAAHPYVHLYSAKRPAIATVTGTYRLTTPATGSAEDDNDIRHIVLDFGRTAFPVLEGQSVGIVPPGVDVEGRPHKLRLYSVASPRNGERPGYNNLALTVKRVVRDHAGNSVRGVASNYLCDLVRGDRVEVLGPFGTTFLMPNHPGSSLLMICTGTGSAPMRAMTERRRRRIGRGEGGSLTLFFGARTKDELPYFGPLSRLPTDFIDTNLAFSREPGKPRTYVQDLLRERGDRVVQLLMDPDCYIYLCGHKKMEAGVKEVLTDLCRERGLDFAEMLPELSAAGRLHIETY